MRQAGRQTDRQADRQTISPFIIIKRDPRSSKLDRLDAATAAPAAKRPRPPGDICYAEAAISSTINFT